VKVELISELSELENWERMKIVTKNHVNLCSSAVDEVEKTKPIYRPSAGNPKH